MRTTSTAAVDEVRQLESDKQIELAEHELQLATGCRGISGGGGGGGRAAAAYGRNTPPLGSSNLIWTAQGKVSIATTESLPPPPAGGVPAAAAADAANDPMYDEPQTPFPNADGGVYSNLQGMYQRVNSDEDYEPVHVLAYDTLNSSEAAGGASDSRRQRPRHARGRHRPSQDPAARVSRARVQVVKVETKVIATRDSKNGYYFKGQTGTCIYKLFSRVKILWDHSGEVHRTKNWRKAVTPV